MYLKAKNPVLKHWVFLKNMNLVLADWILFKHHKISERMNISPQNDSNQASKLKPSFVGKLASIKKHTVKPLLSSFLLVCLALKRPLGNNVKCSDTFKAQNLTGKGLEA